MATHIPSTGTHARERSRFASAEVAHPRIVAPGGPVSVAVHALRDDAVTHINTARLVRLADSVARLHDRLDVMMAATGSALRPALEAMVDSLIEALDGLDGDPDIEDDADAEPSLCGLAVSHPSYGGDDREDDEGERGVNLPDYAGDGVHEVFVGRRA